MLSRTGTLPINAAVASEPPPSPQPHTPGPPIVTSASHSSIPSTAATQIISRGSSSPPPLTTDIHISGSFLLYSPSGRLLSRHEPSDLWGLLISEHATLNCTYAQTTVRVGRAGGCDTVLSDPRVSSTHFTISLELEPCEGSDDRSHQYGTGVGGADASLVQEKLSSRDANHSESCTSGNDHVMPSLSRSTRESSIVHAGGSSANAHGAFSSPENDPESAASADGSTLSPLSNHATARPQQQRREQGAIAAAETGLTKNGRPDASAPSGTPLPGWRMRRVLLTDCSANGTYVNDVLVGRGEYCELHYGDDISIVQVPERKRPGRGSITSTSLSSEDKEVQQEVEKEFAHSVKGEHSVKPQSGTAAASSSTAQHFAHFSSDALASGDVEGVGADANEECSSPKRDNPHVAQLFTALLSTLSTEHSYVERFCFHLYHAEDAGRCGVAIIEPEMVTAPQRAAAAEWEAGESAEDEVQDNYDNSLHQPPPELEHSTVRRTCGAVPRLPFPTSRESLDGNSETRVLHQKLVRLHNDPVASFDVAPQNAEIDSVESPTVSPSILRHGDRRPFLSDSPLPPLAPVQGETTVGAASTPHINVHSTAPSANSSRKLSTVVTPHALLRPRPSIRESFIAPIALSELEGSAASSNWSIQGASTDSTAATRFQESISISPALQRRAAAQRALAARRVSSTTRTQTDRSLGTVGAIMEHFPTDIPIRYAMLPLRHLQWGGRIGFGASGDVFMGIDVLTATVVAIKVLKGSSLFQPPPPPGTAVATARSKANSGRPTVPSVPDDATILNLSNISLGNGTVPVPRVASKSLASISFSLASPTTPRSRAAGRVDGDADAAERTDTSPSHCTTVHRGDGRNEESIQVSEASTPLVPPSADTSSAAAHRSTSAALVSTSSTLHHFAQVQQQPHDKQSASPLLRKHLREIVFLTTLQHHRIVRFLGFQFSGEGRLCLLMEYVAGGTLQTLVKNFGVFEENVIRLYTLQILEGLEYLKRKGVVHGDLKSANILVSEQGSVKLADFGTSRVLRACAAEEKEAGEGTGAGDEQEGAEGQRMRRWERSRELHHAPLERAHKRYDHGNCSGTDAEAEEEKRREDVRPGNSERCGESSCCGSDEELYSACCNSDEDEEGEVAGEDDDPEHRVLCGTPLYMSPELVRTQEPSFASDMWALGCVVYEMATGGILPWRPVHNLSAPAVIWYIGQRYGEDDGPSMDDVFNERSRLNYASTDQSLHERVDDAYEEERGGLRGHSSRGGGGSVGRWDRTPSPMLLDLLQSTLNINPALRPTPAELLQHPFIRNEASDAALDRWHAVLAANRRPASHALNPRGKAEKDVMPHRNRKAELGAASTSTPRPVRGSAGSVFETTVGVLSSSHCSASRDESLHARASLSPKRTPSSQQMMHMEELNGNTPAKVGGENPPGTASRQEDHLLHLPPSLGGPITSPSTGAPFCGHGEPSANLLGDSWGDAESSSLLPFPTPISQPKSHSLQDHSVLGAGNPDSQPLIYEPPRQLDVRGRPMRAPQSIGSQTKRASGLLRGASYGAALVQWWAPHSCSAPTNLPDSPSCAAAALSAGMQQAEVQVPYTMPATRQGSNKSYLRQHQLFLKQNELERRRLSLLAPQGGRQMRGRFRIEGPSPPQQHLLPVSLAPAHLAAGIVPMCPPSYEYAMQQPVLEYSPGYNDYNPQVNTQTVEMRLPPGFTSQSLSVAQQLHGPQKGSSDSNRLVTGVQLQRVPYIQRPFSQQLRCNKARHSSWRERARNAPPTAATANLSPSLRLDNRSSVTAMNASHVRGAAAAASIPANSVPVLSHTSQQYGPHQQLSAETLHPVGGGLAAEMYRLTISSPLVSSCAATMAPLPLEDHRYLRGYRSAPVSRDQPVSTPPQAHCQGPVLPPSPHPHHCHAAQSQLATIPGSGPGGGDGCSAVQEASPTNIAKVEEAVSSDVQQSGRRGRQGRRNASTSSSRHLHQRRLRNPLRVSSLLRQQQQQLSLARIQARVVEQGSKQQQEKLARLSEEALSSQQQANPFSAAQLRAARPTVRRSSTHTAGKKRRIRASPRMPTRATSRRQQQGRSERQQQQRRTRSREAESSRK
ncbi:hypothetical protein CUR178_01903 [Leishmania enriettii]|uniref:non-specific serine/threonine protein kinase n=1 Tax=Leishmania enriettii TaxID=5663 RepID=A0A836GCT0_LEIEN|nr:hypothetical protein CUR178_01903 [Leishmania enriettii]